ncbi:hypothetical protein CEXT_799491 [Caerostris extrusa]|uniref:Uncharacterized protein n=1 Tax=Caerostris extrusa TaxID=172846 RepID=A0AAV4WX82_CAEEX|nr:hypothetical protein CEXT_799491 [Caerostris extrusa]
MHALYSRLIAGDSELRILAYSESNPRGLIHLKRFCHRPVPLRPACLLSGPVQSPTPPLVRSTSTSGSLCLMFTSRTKRSPPRSPATLCPQYEKGTSFFGTHNRFVQC